MTPTFGFSVGDFIAAIDLCTKVAKALKNSGAAAAEYQQVVLELQGLQNILTRLAALEPTESNIQHVNVIRGAALASTLSLQEFLSKLEKFEHSMSPFAAKKTFNMSRAGRQTQYALFMADEVKNMRAVIYGNVIRINVLLATHASETLSRTEDRLATHRQDLTERFQDTRDCMAKIIKEIAEMKAETIEYRDEARQDSLISAGQIQELSNKVEANTATLTQGLSSLSVGIGSITNSVSGIRDLSSQILSLLRIIPAELGGLIQNVIRSNARIESTLLSIDQKIAASPSLSLETNIRLEDALGRIHDIPFEWFQYWETFEGLLKARFKDAPGRQKIENGDFNLVNAKRPSISLNKDSWSGTISPGAQIIMLMLITNIAFRDSSCPRRSCTGKIVSKAGIAGLVTCPECGLRFIPQMTPADGADADKIAREQRIEDSKLFGNRATSKETDDPDLSRQILDVTEDIEMVDVSGDGRADPLESRTPHIDPQREVLTSPLMDIEKAVDSPLTSSQSPEPPIMSWLSQTVPPKNPESVREWCHAAETEQLELKERETKDLEIFRNVQIVMPAEVGALGPNELSAAHSKESDLEIGAQIYYRNILDRYPQVERLLARRLAMGNLQRQKRLTVKQSEAERAKIRAESRDIAPEGRRKRKSSHLKRQGEDVVAEADGWEDVEEKFEERARPLMDPYRRTEPRVDNEHPTFGHTIETAPSWSLPGQLLQAANSSVFDATANPFTPYFLSPQHWQLQGYPASGIPTFDAFSLPSFQQGPFYQSYNLFPNITKTKESRFCSLPPLPLPLAETSISASSMLCYLCHSQVHIRRKQTWRNHVMDDLQPYMCPLADCSDVDATFSRRACLLQHIRRHIKGFNDGGESVRCPFCDVTDLPGPIGRGGRPYIKHIGHHMEEIAFGVVSTAYENWSYDDSGSDPEPREVYPSGFMGNINYPLYSNYYDNGFSMATDDNTHASPVTENFANSWTDMHHTHDDTQYEKNFWTGNMTATSPASSANSGLRDPYPIDYLTAGSAGSESHGFSRSHSTPNGESTKRLKTVTRKHSKNNTESASGEKRVGRRKGPLRPEKRRQAQEIRKLRACLRCKLLKKTCDKGEPCVMCTPSHARLWQVPCTRIAIKDLGYFLNNWKVDYERHTTMSFSIGNIKGFSEYERTIYITHGYGHWFPLSAREVYVRDDSVLGVNWVEAKGTKAGIRSNQQFEVDSAKLSAGMEGVSWELMLSYLDMHIDEGFENFVDEHFEGTLFLTECLKTTYRYFQMDQSILLRKALRLIIAYNLTLNLTMMEDRSQDDETGRVQNPDSKLFGKTAAPVMINFQVKICLADIWRNIQKELLEELDALYSSVYGGEKLKNWDKIFFITLIILAVWEEMQFDCHYRVPDEEVVRKFCSDMEGTPVGVLIGLFCAISHKLPRFEEWNTHKHGAMCFDRNKALHNTLTEMRSHVVKHESYLRSRSRDAKFDRNDFDSLSNKFLAHLVLRENWPYKQLYDGH